MRTTQAIVSAILLASGSVRAQEEKLKASVGEPVLDAVVKEIERLEALAPSEEKASPEIPGPSRQMICMLLVGFSTGSPEVTGLDEVGKKLFGIDRSSKLFQVTPRVRVKVINQWLQDKSGSFCLRHARLYLEKEGHWASEGWGEMPVVENK
jgi:hypothetical protein